MANIRKKNILYSQLSSDYLSSHPLRALVRKMRHDEVARERVPHLKLIILAVWLYCNRTEGFYARLDENFYDSIAEDTDINDDEIKENINWLANHEYFNLELFHKHIITSVDIQEGYFTVVSRLRREMPDLEEMKYVLIDNIHNFYPKNPSDGNPRLISAEEKPISAEELPCSSMYPYKNKEKGYVKVLSSSISSSPGPYNENENYLFYILFYMLDIKDPATEVEKFVSYNETRGWADKKGVKYDTPKKRFYLALRYGQKKEYIPTGRLEIFGIESKNLKDRILAFLFELYQFYRNNLNFKHHLIMNPNTNCQFIPIDGVKFKIKLFVGLHTEEFLISDYDNVLDIGRAVIGSALQEIEFARAGKELLAIEPKEINN